MSKTHKKIDFSEWQAERLAEIREMRRVSHDVHLLKLRHKEKARYNCFLKSLILHCDWMCDAIEDAHRDACESLHKAALKHDLRSI